MSGTNTAGHKKCARSVTDYFYDMFWLQRPAGDSKFYCDIHWSKYSKCTDLCLFTREMNYIFHTLQCILFISENRRVNL